MRKIKDKIANNLNMFCVMLFLIGLILSCFNLFTGIKSIALTIITFVILGTGWGLLYYDTKKKEVKK